MRDSTMAAGLDKLERKFDQLEKFFSKKKRTTARESALLDSGSVSLYQLSSLLNGGSQTFPQPSFIRPTSTRMLAREEFCLASKPARRAQSLPETPSTPGMLPLASTSHVSPSTPVCNRLIIDSFPRIPQRSSSLSPKRRVGSLAELLDFSFDNCSSERDHTPMPSPKCRSRASSKSPSRPMSVSISPEDQPNGASYIQNEPPVTPPTRHQQLYTPPLSAQQENFIASAQLPHEKLLPSLPLQGTLTPEASPRLVPLPEPGVDELEEDETVHGPSGVVATESQAVTTAETPVAPSKPDPVLEEPSFNDFLSLSDDDIADDQAQPSTQLSTVATPPSCALPPDPPAVFTSTQLSSHSSLLTLSPPLASRPATAAAFEAARIAAKYGFDLVYVVNLWPSNMGCSQPRPMSKKSSLSSLATSATIMPPSPTPASTATDASFHSHTTAGSNSLRGDGVRTRMTGRLLAAYGLTSLVSPFRISAPVHQKVLRSQGWLEYRSDGASLDEFARGYSCSFYTGYTPDGKWRPVDGTSPTAEGQPKKRKAKVVNRGIVFAAYRLPRTDGCDIGSDADELKTLHRDAETLVDMLIDIHMMQRQRRSEATRRCAVREAGPLPTPSTPVLSV
ncbi:hypothetical protein B0H66DRAFT_38546 [Apodospora peruviana]|uniref:Uncharacterized protein n=1 Tax=Apodospora peruviana TaxID=516989 RepID=A0AAE0IRC7_9PEZI|nr:hypothetical protein B0H66DRAFT_38546 [Apodospora peruviana]